MDGKKRSREESDDTKVSEIMEEDAVKLMEPFTRDQLLEVLKHAIVRHLDVLEEVRKIADKDYTRKKLFVRGLGNETTEEQVRAVFTQHGEVEEITIITDRLTGKNKGYGFVTYAHVDCAMNALKEPSKKIDGRMTVSNLASDGNPQLQQIQQYQQQLQQQLQQLRPVLPIQPVVPIQSMQAPVQSVQQPIQSMQQPIQPIQQHIQSVQSNSADLSLRRIYVGNVPTDMEPARLINFFSQYGDIEEGPIGYDKITGKCKGYALIVYKTVEATKKAAEDPVKSIDGNQLFCKLATDGQKQKAAAATPGQIISDSNSTGNLKPPSLGSAVQHSGFSHALLNPVPGVHQAAAANPSALAATGVTNYGLSDAAFPSLSRDAAAASLPHHSLNSSMQSSLGHESLGRQLLLQGRASFGTGGYGVSSYGSSGHSSIGGASSLYGIPSSSLVAQNASYEGANQYALALASYQSQHMGALPPFGVPPGGTLPGVWPLPYYPS